MFSEVKRTKWNHRRFLLSEVYEDDLKPKETVCYSRVSSHEQKEDQ
jgi:predicted site-specific integrase-resolvase